MKPLDNLAEIWYNAVKELGKVGAVVVKTIDKDAMYNKIYELYIKQNLTATEVGEAIGKSNGWVRQYIANWGLQKEFNQDWEMPPLEQIEQDYVCSEAIAKDLAERYGVPVHNLRYILKKHGLGEKKREWQRKIREEEQRNRPPPKNRRVPLPDREEFYEKYIVENLTQKELAAHFKVSVVMINRWGKHFGIKKPRELVYANYSKTVRQKYGVDNVFEKNSKVRKRFEREMEDRYGTAIPTRVVSGFSRKTMDIIDDPKKFEAFLKSMRRPLTYEVAKRLKVSHPVVARLVTRYELWHLIDASSSKPEKELGSELRKMGISLGRANRKLQGRFEIDLFSPELNLGVEFNGMYWHREERMGKKYHQEKSLMAEEEGIFIYHIFEYEWNDPEVRRKILNQLRNLFGLNTQVCYARQCEIREVGNEEKREFLEENHIQGTDRSSVKIGLYHQDKLVSLATFCRPRFSKRYNWELSRFCSVAGTNVVGGAGKIFSHFKENYLKKGETVVSYSDIGKTRGRLYQTLGFELSHISAPNYVWCNSTGDIKTRYQCQMKNERQIMEEKKYFRIFDCGNKVWVYTKKE